MTSTTYTFDESEFCTRFINDYYTESDFNLNSAFSEYFTNIIPSSSHEYNWRLFMYFYNKNNNNNHEHLEGVDIFHYLYNELFEIIKKSMN